MCGLGGQEEDGREGVLKKSALQSFGALMFKQGTLLYGRFYKRNLLLCIQGKKKEQKRLL